jgi:hypothetical protein
MDLPRTVLIWLEGRHVNKYDVTVQDRCSINALSTMGRD